MEIQTRPTDSQIWEWLSSVPDPEIPVVSIVDLGIVKSFNWHKSTLNVIITPTYSGCPATTVIGLDVKNLLLQHGINSIQVKTQLSPAWTTDWISTEARKKLKAYGISPPANQACCAGMLPRVHLQNIVCPRCDSTNTECISQFGSTPCKSHYRCKDCLEPFDYFKQI